MNKKDYIDAINEIKVSDKLKKETLNKITKKRSYNKIYAFATAMIIFVIAISIAIPMNVNKNKANPIKSVEQNNGLPKLESFDNYYQIVKQREGTYNNTKGGIIQDATNSESSSLEDTNNKNREQNKIQSNQDYSNTNVQVEGVDEADITKTDGEYIYYVSSNKVLIISAKENEDLKKVSEIEYENENFYPREIFISKERLVVIGETNSGVNTRTIFAEDKIYPVNDNFTVAKIYDTKNKEKLKLEREVKIQGTYISSRMIESNIYLISNQYMYSQVLRDTKKEELNEQDFKPKYIDTVISSEERSIDYSDIYCFPESEDTSYLNIAGFNLYKNEAANINSYLGAGNKVYSSEDNLYVTKTVYEYKDSKTYGYYNNYDVNTYIYRFKLENTKASYVSVGSVPGEVLNQFSMDEKDGYFRVATTDSSSLKSEDNTNNLYVLNQDLEIVGKIEGLAKGEKIYSVRFMDNRAYIVTFVETDPLFVIDLSEPTNPTVLGELEIPGYSKYLHPYDENHIIGFGENTKTTEYCSIVTDGMKMALFDVSNPINPKELYSVDIGEKGTYSELLYNHKSLLFSKEKNIIAFPISISEENGKYHTNLKFQGAIVYGLDLEKGFTLKGTIAHMQIENGYKDYDYTKEVERIIYIQDNLYTLSKGLIKSTDINTMKEQASLEIKI